MPLYVLGLLGMTRRMQHYDQADWHPWLITAGCGALLILCGIACQVAQLVVSIRQRGQRLDATGDPWNGRTLEWATASPPPSFNFAFLPDVKDQEPYWGMKTKARTTKSPVPDAALHYHAIEIPRNSPTGVTTAFFAVVIGFAMVWHIWWLAGLGFLGAYVTFAVFAWRDSSETEMSAQDVAHIDQANLAARAHKTQSGILS